MLTFGAAAMSLPGCGTDGMTDILAGLGYRAGADQDGVPRFRPRDRGRGLGRGKKKAKPKPTAAGKRKAAQEARKAPDSQGGLTGKEQDSPFAKLRDLTAAR